MVGHIEGHTAIRWRERGLGPSGHPSIAAFLHHYLLHGGPGTSRLTLPQVSVTLGESSRVLALGVRLNLLAAAL